MSGAAEPSVDSVSRFLRFFKVGNTVQQTIAVAKNTPTYVLSDFRDGDRFAVVH